MTELDREWQADDAAYAEHEADKFWTPEPERVMSLETLGIELRQESAIYDAVDRKLVSFCCFRGEMVALFHASDSRNVERCRELAAAATMAADYLDSIKAEVAT